MTEKQYRNYVTKQESLLRKRLHSAGCLVSKDTGLPTMIAVGFDYTGMPAPDLSDGQYSTYAGCMSRLLQALGVQKKHNARKAKPPGNRKAVKRERKRKARMARAASDDFLESYEWRKLRYKALKKNDGRCECCGRSRHDGIILHVDHIKPRKKYAELALVLSNLQVLCNECNHGKGNWDETDWRKPTG